jgi:hypothetical protein
MVGSLKFLKDKLIMANRDDEIQQFMQQLYESEDLTNALTDDDARILLDWGKGELNSLVAAADYVDVESAFRELRRVMRSINHLVEQKDELSDTKLIQRLLGLVEQAMQLALKKAITPQALDKTQSE